MKIGFDTSQTGDGKAGCGYFAYSLVKALSRIDFTNTYILYPRFGNHFWDPDAEEKTVKINSPNFSTKLLATNLIYSKQQWEYFPGNGEKRLGNPDIIHSNNFYFPIHIKHARIIYTLYDVSFLDYPEFSTDHNMFGCFNGLFNAAVHADYIISISKYTQSRFLDIFPHFPKERIKVIYPGNRFNLDIVPGNSINVSNELVPDKFWLSVGTREPRKNLKRLLKAFSHFIGQSKSNYPLVLAGGKGWLEDDLEEYILKLGIADKVKLTDYVTDELLSWLYKNCFAFIYPSLYEGFGLPLLEAMSMGAAVISSNVTSLPEVAGNAACLIDPYSEDEIISAMNKLTNDNTYRENLKKSSLSQARNFSWEKCAREVLDLYNNISHFPRRGNTKMPKMFLAKIKSKFRYFKKHPSSTYSKFEQISRHSQ